MQLLKKIALVLITSSGGLFIHSMEPKPSAPSLELTTLKKYVYIKQFLGELTALITSDATVTQEALIPLLATVRYEQLPELLALEDEAALCFNFKKFKSFFQHYQVRTLQERVKALKTCINIPSLEQFFGCTDLNNFIELWAEFLVCQDAQKRQELSTALKGILKNLLKITTERERSGVKKTALLTTYLDLERALILCDDREKGNEVPFERYTELLKSAPLVSSCDFTGKTYAQYCSFSKIIQLIIIFLANPKAESLLWKPLLDCLRWDSIAELLAFNLLEEDTDAILSRPHLRSLMCRIQAGQEITGQELADLICSPELNFYLSNHKIDWNKCATLLNEYRSGKASFSLRSKKNLEYLGQVLGLPLAEAVDTFLPEEIQQGHMKTVIDQCTDSTWFMRLQYTLRCLGIPLSLWLAGHALCHPCMEFFEPQSWYTAGPLALGAIYATFRLGKFFETPKTMKIALVNTALTKALRLYSFLRKEGISKDDIRRQAGPRNNPLLAEHFTTLIDAISYAHLDKLPHNRYELLTLFENPLMFMHTCSPFVESLFRKESYREPQQYEKALKALYALVSITVKEGTLPSDYNKTYTIFTKRLDQPSKEALESPVILELGRFNPQLLLSCYDFIIALQSSKEHMNSAPLSGWLLKLIATYKKLIEQLEKTGENT